MPMAYPGLPQIKLLAEAAAPVFEPAAGVPMFSGSAKLIFPLSGSGGGRVIDPAGAALGAHYYGKSAPLRAIYLLAAPDESQDDISIEVVRGSAAFLSLIENIFIDSVVDAARQKRLFTLLDRLCGQIPVKRLSYPRRHEVMPEVVARIVADARGQRQ